MTETVDLSSRGLEKEIPKWMGSFGNEVISNRQVVMSLHITDLPDRQRWTPQNMPIAIELEEVARKYIDIDPVLTLQACKFQGKPISLQTPANEKLTGPIGPREFKGSLTLELLRASYSEAAIWTNGELSKMENPRAAIVCLDVVTADGMHIFTKRSDSSGTGPGQIGAIGGVLTKSPMQQSMDELGEELGLPGLREEDWDSEYGPIKFESLCFDIKDRPTFIYTARLHETREQVKKAHSESPDAKTENTHLIFLGPEDLLAFAGEHSPSEFHPPADLLLIKLLQRSFLTDQEENLVNMLAGSS